MKGTSLLQRLTKAVPRKSGLIQLCTFPCRRHWAQAFYCLPPSPRNPQHLQDLAGSHCTAMHPDLNTCEVLCSQKTNVAQAQGEGMPAALGNNSML